MEIQQYLAKKKKKIDKELDKLLPKSSKSNPLIQAMRYSVFSGGKRLRPILTLEVARLLGDKKGKAMTVACAIEFIHTFSLIHDDLPCMDNDDYRRGKLTCHRVFGEDVALLAGDALLNQAYVCLVKGYQKGDFSKEILGKLVFEFSQAIGGKGLIGGQIRDLTCKNKKVNLKILEKIYLQKTAALFILSVRIGAIVASARKEQLIALSNFAKNFGLAFQIIDDCLDYKKDSFNYLSLVKPQMAKIRAQKYITQAKECLGFLGKGTVRLKQIVKFALEEKL